MASTSEEDLDANFRPRPHGAIAVTPCSQCTSARQHSQSFARVRSFLSWRTSRRPRALANPERNDVKQLDITQGSLELGSDMACALVEAQVVGAAIGLGRQPGMGCVAVAEAFGRAEVGESQEDDFRLGKTAAESIIVLKPVDSNRPRDIGLGLFGAIEASLHPDTTNGLIFGPIMTLTANKLSLTANPFLEKTFGRNRVGASPSTMGGTPSTNFAQASPSAWKRFGVVENLADPPPWSAQEHRIGPAIFTEIELTKDFKITPDIGVFFGLTPATPDVAIKLNVGIPLARR